jgi:hypothetical protein
MPLNGRLGYEWRSFWELADNTCYTAFHARIGILNPSQPFNVHIRAREFESQGQDRTSVGGGSVTTWDYLAESPGQYGLSLAD